MSRLPNMDAGIWGGFSAISRKSRPKSRIGLLWREQMITQRPRSLTATRRAHRFKIRKPPRRQPGQVNRQAENAAQIGVMRRPHARPGRWPASAGWLRSLRPARAAPAPPSHLTSGPSRPLSDPRPVLRPLLTSARSAPTSRCGPPARRQLHRNRHPGRPPRIRTTTFPLRPPRLRDDPADGDGLHLLEQAHPNRPAFYAIRVPRCRDTPRASFPPRLTATQLPPARS